MAKSQRLAASDYRRVHELVHRITDIGNDPDAWRFAAAAGLRELVRAHVSMTSDLTNGMPSASPRLVQPIDTGWATASARRRYLEYYASGEVTADPGTVALLELNRQIRFLTRTRRQMVADREWYASPAVSEARRAAGVDDFVCTSFALGPGVLQGFIVYRAWGDRQFGMREQRLARQFHLELLRKIFKPRPQPASLVALSPRLSEILTLFLSGLSTNEVAARLGISFHTANDYAKALYKRLGVRSRAALFALCSRTRTPTICLPAELIAAGESATT